MNPVLPAVAWCVLLLGAQLLRTKAFGRKALFAPAHGDPAAGVRYAFTGAMLPWAKESVRMNPVSYLTGILFHAGLMASFLLMAWPRKEAAPFALLGALAGLGLLAKRAFKKHLRAMSNGDDFVSNLLVTGFCALAAASPFLPSAATVLPWECAALLVYIPLGKIRHCVFFFLSRTHLGAFFGRRGTFPPAA